MSGHSHWATIKHKKAAADAKKGKAFSKVVKLIMAAAKKGGGDPKNNLKLLYALEKAKDCNLPKDTIEKAIKKGTGELEGVTYDDVTYEGYGPGGCAVMVDALTDNRNRTVSEIRKIFDHKGGNLGDSGCVGFMFEKKGILLIPRGTLTEDAAMELGLEIGAEDVQPADDQFEIVCAPADFAAVVGALKAKNIETSSASIVRVAKTRVDLPNDKAKGALGLMDALEEHDDVQEIASNFNLPEGFVSL
ncbi:MAG: YebC/PmpR family DNA-binding transcriptional regulator [Candidatus Brocadiae bacterium]|nr:YebC/PmpR family DNA-binding transcriptional regulator [Candidatus Brocadiia bacterium]